jgi:hypothetical protein
VKGVQEGVEKKQENSKQSEMRVQLIENVA